MNTTLSNPDLGPSPPHLKQIVRLIASYRLLCGCFIYLSAQSGIIDSAQFFRPELYQQSALVYTFGALIGLLVVVLWPRYLTQQYIVHLSFDLILLGLICYYSGGAANQHDILPILSSAFSITVLPARQALGVVATCVIILLGVELALSLGESLSTSFFSIGVEGMTAMGLMPLLFMLSTRLQKAQQSALSTHQDYQQLAEVNWDIINCMNTGCIIVDQRQLIVHVNPSASALFATDPQYCIGQNLATFNEQLYRIHQQENQSGFHEAKPIHLLGLDSYVLPHFFPIKHNEQTVILLDNLHQEIANIHQSRLATFGKMIHALMHEIKNPLATMEQALQRLPDTDDNTKANDNQVLVVQEVLPILHRQIHRMVNIVQSTRNLLPNRKLKQESIQLLEHIRMVIEEVSHELRFSQTIAAEQFRIDIDALDKLVVRFDPVHLTQVLNNLINNSIEHSQLDSNSLEISITGRSANQFIELEYWDNGVGIGPDQREHIYRAFYSSEHEHAGLGLHISNELCQLNGANLEYISLSVPARFRLSLPLG